MRASRRRWWFARAAACVRAVMRERSMRPPAVPVVPARNQATTGTARAVEVLVSTMVETSRLRGGGPTRHRGRSAAGMLVLAALCGAPSAAPAQAAAPAAIAVAHPYAWPTPPGGTSGAVYLRELVNRGTEADALVGVSSPGADRVELHTMQMDGDVMRMRALPSLPLAAGARVTMAPGSGYHLMFTGIRAPWKIGDRIPLTLQFRRAGRFETTVVVEPRSAAAPVPHGHDAPMPMRMPMPMSPGVGDR